MAFEATRRVKTPIVIAATQGGLGNQLFQLAASIGITQRTQGTLLVDGTGAANRSSCVLTFGSLQTRLSPTHRLQLKRLSQRGENIANGRRTSYVLEDDASPHFALPTNRTIVLKGYFQDAQYWWDARQLVRTLALRELEERSSTSTDLKQPTIGVHVRRGDYLHGPAAHELGFVGTDYYRYGISYLRSLLPGAQVIVFSDDQGFVQSTDFGVDVIDGSSNVDVDTILKLARCDGLVMSNSSMSWWGSFLSGASGERIVCPKPWSPTKSWLDPSLSDWTLFNRTEYGERNPSRTGGSPT